MNCNEASRLMSLKMEGAMDAAQAEALERHLGECPACRDERRDLERLAAALSALPEPALPDGLGERLRRAVGEQPALAGSGRGARPLFAVLALAAMVMLAVGVAYLVSELRTSRAECARLASALEAAPRRFALSAPRPYSPGITPTEAAVVEQLQAFRATRDYLGCAMRWMVTDGDQVEVGMSGGSAGQVACEEKDTIVLNCEYREVARGQEPQILSKPEFVLFSGDEVSVRLRSRSAGEPILRYRVIASRVIGGRIRAEVSFANEALSRDDVNATLSVRTLLTPGKPALIGAGSNGDRRWELYLWAVARPAGYRGPPQEPEAL